MFKVLNGAIHHNGEVYRQGDELPESFDNRHGYKHVEEIKDEKPEPKKTTKGKK